MENGLEITRTTEGLEKGKGEWRETIVITRRSTLTSKDYRSIMKTINQTVIEDFTEEFSKCHHLLMDNGNMYIIHEGSRMFLSVEDMIFILENKDVVTDGNQIEDWLEQSSKIEKIRCPYLEKQSFEFFSLTNYMDNGERINGDGRLTDENLRRLEDSGISRKMRSLWYDFVDENDIDVCKTRPFTP